MNRSEALDSAKKLVDAYSIRPDELFSTSPVQQPSPSSETASVVIETETKKNKASLAEVFYFIGGGIVVLAVFILVGMSWDNLASPLRLLLTLGLSAAAYATGWSFSKNPATSKVAVAFYLIFCALLPVGIFTALDTMGFGDASAGLQTTVSLVASSSLLALFYASRRVVFLLFGIIYSTWLFFSLLSLLVGQANGALANLNLYEYGFLVSGLGYLLLAYVVSTRNRLQQLSGFLYSFGAIFFLGAVLWLGGWTPDNNLFWELIAPLLIGAVIYLSVRLSRTSLLVWGNILLVIYILKLSSEFFADSLGWPIILMIVGLAVIGISFGATKLKKQMFHTHKP